MDPLPPGGRAALKIRLFPSDLDPAARRVYAATTVFYLVVFLAVTWPVYALFAGIEPRLLGLPLSLAWVVGWVIASFLGLLGLHLWEERRERSGEDRRRSAEDRREGHGR